MVNHVLGCAGDATRLRRELAQHLAFTIGFKAVCLVVGLQGLGGELLAIVAMAQVGQGGEV
ncbi:MAG: hypothetical protein ACFB0C_23715 [Leptolyngbyaceae cyanobacterium]